MKEAAAAASVTAFGQKVGRGFDATKDAAAARSARTARLKEELWEDVREKFESLLQGLELGGGGAASSGGPAADGSNGSVRTPSAAGAGADGTRSEAAVGPVQFDMRESKGGLLRFDPKGPLGNLTVALTSFDSREWATDVTVETVTECEILAASDVFDRWVLESMMQHTEHFCRQDVVNSVFGDDGSPPASPGRPTSIPNEPSAVTTVRVPLTEAARSAPLPANRYAQTTAGHADEQLLPASNPATTTSPIIGACSPPQSLPAASLSPSADVAHSLPQPLCADCGEDDATAYCQNCNKQLCGECDVAIHRKGLMKSHFRESIAGAKGDL